MLRNSGSGPRLARPDLEGLGAKAPKGSFDNGRIWPRAQPSERDGSAIGTERPEGGRHPTTGREYGAMGPQRIPIRVEFDDSNQT